MVAVLGVSLVGAAGLALDVGLYYLGNRDLRAATEAAALAAAMNPLQAESRARDYLVRNGYDASVLKSVQLGRYCADSGLSSEQRFDATMARCPGNGLANAVRVTTGKSARRYLTGVLGDASPIPDLGATASAARVDEAGVGITSGLLTVTNSLVNLVNDLLGALLGIKLRLSTADIEGMMNGDVDAGLFFDALARNANFTGTYGQLVQGSYGLKDVANAAASATTNPATKAGLTAFASQVTNGYQVPMAGLFGLGVWKNMPVGEADVKPALRAGMNAYQLISFAAQAGPGAIDLSDTVSLLVPGSTVRVGAVASGPMDRPRFSFGPAGETVAGTSMLRLQVLIELVNLKLPVVKDLLSAEIPVILDVAAARAEVASINCAGSTEQKVDTRVTVNATSGLVNAYIGTAPTNAMTKPIPSLTAADIKQASIISSSLLGIPIIDVKARAIAQPVLGNSAALVFGPGGQGTIGTPAAPGRSASIGNGSQVGPLLTSLVSSISAPDGLQVNLLGLCIPLVCEANTAAVRSALLSAIVTPVSALVGGTVDPLLDNLLAALGIQLGHATVWVTGARCGVPVLI
ncbi:MAG: hypothetical protein E2586_16890 [Novosphingobium sp.]|nr:hypothetical protein [Novosphingobium sp.]